MRGHIPSYEMLSPSTLHEALSILNRMDSPTQTPIWKPFAGGTDIMVLLEAGRLAHLKWLNIWNLNELKQIHVEQNQIKIGSLSTYTEILENPLIQGEFSLLCESSKVTGSKAIQARGTLGGNIVNASPAGDSLPALLVYDAQLKLTSANGTRIVPYVDFHQGYKSTLLKSNELIEAILLNRQKTDKTSAVFSYFQKIGTRKSQAISKINFTGLIHYNLARTPLKVRIALGAMGPVPIRALKTEDFVLKSDFLCLKDTDLEPFYRHAKNLLLSELSPIDDIRSSRSYRLEVAQNVLMHFLKSAREHDVLD